MSLKAGSRLISPAKKSLPPTQIVLENKDRGSFEEAVSALLISW